MTPRSDAFLKSLAPVCFSVALALAGWRFAESSGLGDLLADLELARERLEAAAAEFAIAEDYRDRRIRAVLEREYWMLERFYHVTADGRDTIDSPVEVLWFRMEAVDALAEESFTRAVAAGAAGVDDLLREVDALDSELELMRGIRRGEGGVLEALGAVVSARSDLAARKREVESLSGRVEERRGRVRHLGRAAATLLCVCLSITLYVNRRART